MKKSSLEYRLLFLFYKADSTVQLGGAKHIFVIVTNFFLKILEKYRKIV
jgi:hypothetical protein